MLYLKYRPRFFKDVVGQGENTKILLNQVRTGHIGHAYLFCGNRGSGKTTTARIFAKAVNQHDKNGEPLDNELSQKIDTGNCIDIVELDAASHNGIEDIRNIIEQAQYAPSECKYRVFIIDEVHMLSISAVNAFLKVLEEPPKNVIFILATTDPQKLPITILSRCQRFDFRRIDIANIFNRLKYICKNEKIAIDDESLKLISIVADGAMRDAISILDQVRTMEEISYSNVVNLLGIMIEEDIRNIAFSIIKKDTISALQLINKAVNENKKDANQLMKDLQKYFRNVLVLAINPNTEIATIEEEKKFMLNLGKQINKKNLIKYIELLQEKINDSKYTYNNLTLLEVGVIELVEYKTEEEKINNIIKKVLKSANTNSIAANNCSDMNNDNNINNIFEQSKQYVINTLLQSPKDYIVDIGNGLKSSQISYNNGIINIMPLNDNDRKILINGIKALNAGFIKTLRENNIEVQKINIQ
ncbi:DNA polymerase III, subunits gamma and tau (plasmid) [Clostridium botulinum Af84]|uniref:DNA polymerase III subunit gamma/tau n=1 Tax=Clostridium botulinum TaxID=1491 RepID=UPI00035BA490|nr:DNA polymerase III subunit gamma/tau [Clostridium botulinum]APR02643.1 DNA polymerase III, subunit gamma and tau [Clostridium botulinum]AUN19748.1 DNA polymerase III, subunit gamma and tau [Clostridium botulinum]EPS54315.1 DNA polymerase III, subunits gamma and tau [Clostridium botulinum Af84]NFM82252.1 DNA polymerase III subunit gamma/tau [Clostridium botulinum]NFP09943.1 DNA polymerase III subunit gamma/tau [Clostridium botulinum]